MILFVIVATTLFIYAICIGCFGDIGTFEWISNLRCGRAGKIALLVIVLALGPFICAVTVICLLMGLLFIELAEECVGSFGRAGRGILSIFKKKEDGG